VLRVDGGLARNDSVLQAIADLSGLRLERTAAAEVTALGAGALAGLGTGQWDEAALAALPFETDRTVLPGLAQSEAGTARTAWQRVLAGVLGGVPGGRPGDVPGGRPEHPGAGPDRPGQAGGAP
jgi:glycerol kinase